MISVFAPTVFMPQPAGGGTTTFDPSHHGTGTALSGGNLTATEGTPSGGNGDNTRSVASHSSGKFYCEFTWVQVNSAAADMGIGICNAAQALNNSFIGDAGSNSLGAYGTSGAQVDINGSASSSWLASGPITNGTVTEMAVDFTASKIWLRALGGSWNNNPSADPAGGLFGIDISVLNAGPYFAAVNFEFVTQSITANFGGSAYVDTPPSGFGNW